MTGKDAAEILKTFRITGDKHHEALDVAIKALEQELIFEEIKAEALSLKINYTDFDRDAYRRGINDVLKIIDKYKAETER